MLMSIVIPFYNSEKYIERCLKSLIDLKRTDIEFIFVNDGSTDNSCAICEKYAELDNRVKIIKQRNAGVGAARNTGIDNSSGKYITFVDADDWVLPQYGEVIEEISILDCDIICFDYMYWRSVEDNEVYRRRLSIGNNRIEELLDNLLDGGSNNVWSNIYRREIIIEHDIKFPKDISIGEDYFFNILYFSECSSVIYINKTIYCYDISNQSSAMHNLSLKHIDDYIKVFDAALQMCNKKEISFQYDYQYYLDQVFYILFNSSKIEKQFNEKFRTSELFQGLMSNNYHNWTGKVKKYMLYANLYNITVLRRIIKNV